jgi:hypothetical protein
MEEYREKARLRYENEINKIKEEEETKKEIERIHSEIYDDLEKWDEISESLENMTTKLALLLSILTEEFIEKLEKYDRLDEIQERVSNLVEKINDVCKKSESSLRETNEMNAIMKEIISLTKVEIPIQIMNTDDDEEVAKRLEQEIFDEVKEDLFHEIPIVSLSSNRVGLTLVEIRDLAKRYGIKEKGKKELAISLAGLNLVKIVL